MMRFISFFSFLFFTSLPVLGSEPQLLSGFLQKETFLSLDAAKSEWGSAEVVDKTFRLGPSDARKKMAVHIVENPEVFVGKNVKEIMTRFGAPDGYFFSDSVPAYLLNEGWRRNENTWQLVFLPNHFGKVQSVRIHRNCCSN